MMTEEGSQLPSPGRKPDRSVLQFPSPSLPTVEDSERPFTAFFERVYDPLRRYATAELGDADVAEDIVQSTLMALWLQRYQGKTPPEGDLLPLAYHMVKLRVLNQRRDRKRYRMKLFEYLELWSGRAKRWMVPSEELEHEELTRAIEDAVNDMPARCREVFQLRRESRLSFSAIAASMGLSEETVQSYMHRAQRVLRGHVDRAGFGVEARRRAVDKARRKK